MVQGNEQRCDAGIGPVRPDRHLRLKVESPKHSAEFALTSAMERLSRARPGKTESGLRHPITTMPTRYDVFAADPVV